MRVDEDIFDGIGEGRNLLFYDLESYKHDALAVFMDWDGNTYSFWNDFSDVPDLIHGKILVGYNNFHYDDYLLFYMMIDAFSPEDLHRINRRLVDKDGIMNGLQKVSIAYTLDASQECDGSQLVIIKAETPEEEEDRKLRIPPSLKELEARMGWNIHETPIDFDREEALTPEERSEAEDYCKADVRACAEIFRRRLKPYFLPKLMLAKMAVRRCPCLSLRYAMHMTNPTLTAKYLTAGTKVTQLEGIAVPKALWRASWIPSIIWDMWEDQTKDRTSLSGTKHQHTIDLYGLKVTYSLGGAHGVPARPCRCSEVIDSDVASLYPSIIVKLGLLGDSTGIFDSLRTERIAIKQTDPIRAAALKLILNSTYGVFNAEHSLLYNPFGYATISLYGQIVISKLAQMLYEAGYQLLNLNTDGIFYSNPKHLPDEVRKTVCHQWEQEFSGLRLDTETFPRLTQKDVNAYICHDRNRILKTKGKAVMHSKPDIYKPSDAVISSMAAADWVAFNKPVYQTITEHLDDLSLFQIVLRSGSKFAGVSDAEGHMFQKVNRVFPIREGYPSTKLYKCREDGSLLNFQNAPDRMLVFNQALDSPEADSIRQMLDLTYYARLADSYAKGWARA